MIWLLGAHGMLGSTVCRKLEQNNISFHATGHEVDITNRNTLELYASRIPGRIDWIINCAAYTAVDTAEDNSESARKLNEDGPRNLARLARSIGAKLIHISTDYVFDGTSSVPYTESMQKCPDSTYGKTKAAGEDAVEREMTQYYILRTAWLYGVHGHNFVYTMTKLMNSRDTIKVVHDQYGTPTNCATLTAVILQILTTEVPFGIYHVTDQGQTTWYDFAAEIYRLGKKYRHITHECTIDPCTTAEYPVKAKRPLYSVLSKDKIENALRIRLPKWQKSLEQFMKEKDFSPQ